MGDLMAEIEARLWARVHCVLNPPQDPITAAIRLSLEPALRALVQGIAEELAATHVAGSERS